MAGGLSDVEGGGGGHARLTQSCFVWLWLLLCCVVCVPGPLSAQAQHPIWGQYASSLLQQGVSRPKVRGEQQPQGHFQSSCPFAG